MQKAPESNKINRPISILSILFGIGLAIFFASTTIVINRTNLHSYKIAAGSVKGESYLFSLAIAETVKKYHPQIELVVIPSDGSKENIEFLESNKVQLATAQADTSVNSSAQIVSFLYRDVFQSIVKADDGIRSIADLRGLKIARPPKQGGQIKSLQILLKHYGLKENDIKYVDIPIGAASDLDQAIDREFIAGRVDAVFRIRPIGNKSILNLIEKSGGKLIPIDQSEAMQIGEPNYKAASIPKGTYRGNPPIPASDLPTVSIERILFARKDLSSEDIQQIVEVLYEHRQELDEKMAELSAKDARLAGAIPLAAYIHPPKTTENISRVPIHSGAAAYLDREKPSFLKANADVLALLFPVVALFCSWLWELKSRLDKKRKDRSAEYTKRAIAEFDRVAIITTDRNIEPLHLRQQLLIARKNLLEIFKESVTALNDNRISQESFQSFRIVWQIAMDAVEHEEKLIEKSFDSRF
jgi:uncharacterized protein